MKSRYFSLAMVLACGLGLASHAAPNCAPSYNPGDTSQHIASAQKQAQPQQGSHRLIPKLPHLSSIKPNGNDDTINMYRITFVSPINEIVLKDFCNLKVVPDTANFLTYANSSKKIADHKSFTYKLLSNGVLTIEGLSNSRQLELHLTMGNQLAIRTNDFSNAFVQINSPLLLLSIKTNDYSNVFVTTEEDSIRSTTISIVTNDFSNASIKNPVATSVLKLKSNDFSNIQLPDCSAHQVFRSQSEESNIRTGKLHSYSTFEDFDEGMEEVRPITKPAPQKPSFFHDGGWEFGFAWAFTNWGRTPWSALNPTSGPYGLGTTFSSYQLELVYYPLCTKHFKFGMGLGYGSNVYRFSDRYVTLVPPVDGVAGDFLTEDRTDAKWNSRMVARYVTMPISIVWQPNVTSDFSIGLAAIPGVNYASRNTGLKHKGESTTNQAKMTDVENMSAVMNPLQLDARLSLNYNYFSVFVQMSTLPVMKNMEKDVYPIKLGFILRLYDD